jgi:hypothetical protein
MVTVVLYQRLDWLRGIKCFRTMKNKYIKVGYIFGEKFREIVKYFSEDLTAT